ncbi:MAG: bifunctional aspartate aminotransferase [Sylvanvirus sp.]|uniref:Bifunctional aspartate aminotransferase n=1 Tax=Sylvanvirus sp. TaxID=2487774 RepID=A0A3G5AJ73_9VIRU|nr:MAG: bifunctional aspartate aminotransferase [Sylvanvirus sp.]
MSANRTNRTIKNNVPSGLPHQTKISRKPEGVGSEIRCVIDARSQVMLQLELQESKEEMATKKYVQDGESLSTAGVLRLVEPWFNTSRMVYGDSACASVNTAVKLRERGLHFSGLVKTAHREFPTKYFNSLNIGVRSGDSRYLTTTKNEFPLIATAWWDKKVKFFISTAGTNGIAQPHRRVRYRLLDDGSSQRIEKTTKISATPHEYFSFAQKVDVHNHRRQGILAMERKIPTRNWAFRLVSTLLGMIMVDAYMIFLNEKHLRDEGDEELTFHAFVDTVGYELATNSLVDSSLRARRPREDDEAKEESENIPNMCSLARISDVIERQERKRKSVHLQCKICGGHTAYCCQRCSTPGKVIAVCNFTAKRVVPCFNKHLESITIDN